MRPEHQGPPRYICVTQYGAPGAVDRERLQALKSMRESVGRGVDRCLELVTYGVSDLLTIHALHELGSLAVMNATAPFSYQRAQGGVVCEVPGDSMLMSVEQMLVPDPKSPFYGVMSVKIDPLVDIISSTVADELRLQLPAHLKREFDNFNDKAITAVKDFSSDASRSYAVATPDKLGGIQILPLAGLDSSELVVIVRSPRLEWIARVFWSVRRLRLGSLGAAAVHAADDSDLRISLPGLALDRIADLPLLAYTTTTVGVPREILENQLEVRRDETACAQGTVICRFGALPDRPACTDQMVERFGEAIAGVRKPRSMLRMSVFGGHDQFVQAGNGSIDSKAGTVESGTAVGEITWGQAFDALRLSPVGERGTTDGYVWETSIYVQAFPPGFPRPDVQDIQADAASTTPSMQEWFDQELHSARDLWVEQYRRLKNAATDGHWPYSNTNGALNLVLSLITLVATRREIDSYLDLIRPLHCWMKRAIAEPGTWYRGDLKRIYNHLDRAMHARSHRDGPGHLPGVSRAFEARSGYVLPRDGFNGFLEELLHRRLGDSITSLLIDGTDAGLVVKPAGNLAIFYVSALRLHQPVLWPAVSHEVEHVRLNFEEANPDWRKSVKRVMGSAVVEECGPSWEDVLANVGSKIVDSCPGAQRSTLDEAIGNRRASSDDQIVECPLAEIACDLAIYDSGVLETRDENAGDDERDCRFCSR